MRKITRQLPDMRTDQKPRRLPVSRCSYDYLVEVSEFLRHGAGGHRAKRVPVGLTGGPGQTTLHDQLENGAGPHGLSDASISRRRMALMRDW